MAASRPQQKGKYQAQNIRLPLLGSMTNRSTDSTKDQRFINIFPETRKVEAIESTRIFLNKRPGLTLYKTIFTGAGRGLVWFRNKFYAAIDGKVFEDVTPVITLVDATTRVGMIVGNCAAIGDFLFICDGTSGWIIKTDGSVTKITDVNFPTPHIPLPTFIDGYIILAKGSDVYNSSLATPLTWASGEYLTAEMFPDAVVALGRQNNQVVVFGENSTEFFYDAANTSGSPLNRNESTTLQTGCAFPYAIYQNEKTFIFTGQSESGGRAVWQVDGFQPKKVSDEFIERIIDAETDTQGVRGFGFRSMGHLFYLVNLPTLQRTLVYDTVEKLWHEWSSNNAGSHTSFMCSYMCDAHTGAAYLLHNTNGTIYRLDPTVYADAGTNILVEIITNKYDMDTYKRKFLSNIRPVGDRYTVGNTIDIRWSDDDYQTWSNVHTLGLSDDFPNMTRLGSFRRRAFDLKHALNYPLRLESLEVTYYEGDS